MKAKISYTVDLDSIPQEVIKMLELPQFIIHKLDSEYFEISKDTVYKTINQIEQIRQKLLLADTRLAECQSVLVGYNQELARQKSEESSEQQSVTETAHNADDS